MWAHDSRSHAADVVVTFENQDDADDAVYLLRLTGFRDRQIGYTGRLLNGHVVDLLERDRSFGGAALGGLAGAALGVGLAPVLAWLMAPPSGVYDLFGLAVTCGVFGALFLSFLGGCIGMSVPRSGMVAPATGSTDPFVIAVAAGTAHDRAAEIVHEFGGHDLPMVSSHAA